MRYGLDFLLGSNYGDLILKEFPDQWAAGFILNTTTAPTKKPNAWPVIEALLKTGRCPEIRLHAIWDDKHQYIEKRDLPVILREAKRAEALRGKFPGVKVLFSWFCEHNENASTIKKVYNEVKKVMPTVTFVNCVWKGAIVPGITNEVHGGHKPPPGPFLFSYDGKSCFDSDVEKDKKTYRSAGIFFFWFPQMNGRLKADDKTPRPQRKAWPTSREIDSAIYLSTPSGVGTKLPKGYLFKSHADRHLTPPEPRAGKPVLIAPVANAKIHLTTRSGQVVDSFKYAGSFTGGGYRYYAGDWGYLTAEKAKRIQGDNRCQLRVNGKVIAEVNPAFRSGGFR